MSSHLNESERHKGNKRNGSGSKRVKTMTGEIDIEMPQDRHSSFSPEILKKRETILADNMSSKIISLYGMSMSLVIFPLILRRCMMLKSPTTP